MLNLTLRNPAGFALMLLLAHAGFIPAQNSPWGSGQTGIQGRVTDTLGRPVAGVSIRVRGPQGKREMLTDSDGRYHFMGLVSGPYAVEVTLGGLTKELPQRTSIQVYKVTQYDIVLKLTICPPEERLTCRPRMVEATSPPLRPQG